MGSSRATDERDKKETKRWDKTEFAQLALTMEGGRECDSGMAIMVPRGWRFSVVDFPDGLFHIACAESAAAPTHLPK
jgi:hypothetical protein